MEPGRASLTAFRVAVRRAAHQLVDRPCVLDDPIAVPLLEHALRSMRPERRNSLHGPSDRLWRHVVAIRRIAFPQPLLKEWGNMSCWEQGWIPLRTAIHSPACEFLK